MTLPNYTRAQQLPAILRERIAILDGAMGTMIQRFKLTEEQYRGARFADFPRDVKGNNELLSLTRPDVIRDIHEGYLAAVLPLLDWVGLDIKGPEHRYADITGVPGSGARAFESLTLLQASPVAFECRTTWHAGLYEAQELQALGDQLAGRGVRHWAVQVCRHVPGAPDVTPSTVAAPVGAQIPRFEVRGGQRGAVG